MPTYRLEKNSVQWRFNRSRAKVQIFGGAFANGKTTALVMKALGVAVDYPGAELLLARETYPKLNDTLRKVFLKWCPPIWIKKMPTQDDNSCYLKNGSAVHFRYVSQRGKNQADGSTTSNLLSATYDFIGFDQLEDPGVTYKDFLDLAGRLRGDARYHPDGPEDATMPGTGPRWLCLTLNPTRNWAYKKLIMPYLLWHEQGIMHEDLLIDPDTKQPILELFESDVYANKANLERDYIKSLEVMYKGQMRERYLLGKWAAFEGLVHPTFEVGRNTLTRTQALDHLHDCHRRHVKVKAIEAYDFGLVSPSCYMVGFVDDLGRVIILDGYYQSEFDYTLQPDRIREIRLQYMGLLNFKEPINADPAIFRKQVIGGQRNTGDTIARLYGNMGIHTRPASNDITAGIAKVNAYITGMKEVPNISPNQPDGAMFYVVDDLIWFQDEIGSYYWKKNPLGSMIDEPQEHADHAMNTLKYMLAHLPEPSKVRPPKETLPPGWMRWQEMEVGEYQRRVSHTRR